MKINSFFFPSPSLFLSNDYFKNIQSSQRDQKQALSLSEHKFIFQPRVYVHAYTYRNMKQTNKQNKATATPKHGIDGTYVDSLGSLFYLLHFHFERKIGFGVVSVYESAVFEFKSTSGCNKAYPLSQLLLHLIQILYFKNIYAYRII